MDLIRKDVQNGGGLVSTEQTALYDDWRRRLTNYGLADVFVVKARARCSKLE